MRADPRVVEDKARVDVVAPLPHLPTPHLRADNGKDEHKQPEHKEEPADPHPRLGDELDHGAQVGEACDGAQRAEGAEGADRAQRPGALVLTPAARCKVRECACAACRTCAWLRARGRLSKGVHTCLRHTNQRNREVGDVPRLLEVRARADEEPVRNHFDPHLANKDAAEDDRALLQDVADLRDWPALPHARTSTRNVESLASPSAGHMCSMQERTSGVS